jgi:hypothetical protein
MNRDWILFNLVEAQEELAKTIRDIKADLDYDYGEFLVAMQHLYHHVNTAWNSRDATSDQVANETEEDFGQWSRFPGDLPMMGS